MRKFPFLNEKSFFFGKYKKFFREKFWGLRPESALGSSIIYLFERLFPAKHDFHLVGRQKLF